MNVVRIRRWIGGWCLAAILGTPFSVMAQPAECANHGALVERIERLEALAAAFQAGRRVGETIVAPQASATEVPAAELSIAGPRRETSKTFHAQTQYLPSRGWEDDTFHLQAVVTF